MKKSRDLIVWTVLVVLVTCFIFFNSFQNSTTSNGATDSVLGALDPLLEMLDTLFGQQDWFFLLRKAAHLTEFAVLGAVTLCAAKALSRRRQASFYVHAAFYALAVAVTDEFIQSFSDRTSGVSDVLIDFSGALIGFACVMLIRFLYRLQKERTKTNGH